MTPTKKPSVHFSPAATIIPDLEEPEEQDIQDGEQSIPGEEQASQDDEELDMAIALYDFNADGEDELTVKEGEKLTILERDGEEWWKCRNTKGLEGVVPASYLEVRVDQLYSVLVLNNLRLQQELMLSHPRRITILRLMIQKQEEQRMRRPRGKERPNACSMNRKKIVGVQRQL